MHQRGDGVGEQLVEKLAVPRTEVAEHVVIDTDSAADPQVSQIALTQSIEVSRTADRFDRGKHPQRHQNFRIDRVASRPTAPSTA